MPLGRGLYTIVHAGASRASLKQATRTMVGVYSWLTVYCGYDTPNGAINAILGQVCCRRPRYFDMSLHQWRIFR